MAKKRVLGLDTGSNSLGWAIVDREESGEQTLVDKGTLIFQEGVKIEKGIESSKAADRTAPSADGTAGTGAGEKGKIECSAASQFLFLPGSSAISGCTGELAGSADQLLCNPTKTAAVITGGNRKPVFTGEQSGQTGACCE